MLPIEPEILKHFQTLVQVNTTDPPGGERPAAEYLKQVLEREGIPVTLYALEDHRPNLVARLATYAVIVAGVLAAGWWAAQRTRIAEQPRLAD